MASKHPLRLAAACIAAGFGFVALRGQSSPSHAQLAVKPAVAKPSTCSLPSESSQPWSGHPVHWRLEPVPNAAQGSYEEISRILTRADWEALNAKQRVLAIRQLRNARAGRPVLATCFAPGTDLSVVRAFRRVEAALRPFRLTTRWTSTATTPTVNQGGPMVLTWNIVPDGTPIPDDFSSFDPTATVPSNLQAFVTERFGSVENFRQKLRTIFARYEALSGIRYIEVNYDDAAVTRDNPGVLGTRADVRIGGMALDGDYGVLAYDYFPNISDMVIDTSDAIFTSQTSAELPNPDLTVRNILAHEHGHGLGLMHTCPLDESKLMEPFLSTNFDGPQLDDIQGLQHYYGDTFESPAQNNTKTSATDLGTLGLAATTFKTLSIGDVNDVDIFKLKTDATRRRIQVTVSVPGAPYPEGAQSNNGSCTSGTTFNPTNRRNLALRLTDANGIVLADVDTNPAGTSESFAISSLPGTGPFYLRVSGSDNSDNTQVYNLNISVQEGNPNGAATVTGRCVSIFANADFNGSQRIGLAGARVTLKRSDGVAIATTTTDSSGNYSIPNVSPGNYTVTSEYDRDESNAVVMDPASRPVTVDVTDVPVPRFALYSIFGTVKAPNKQGVVSPISSAVVSLYNPKGVKIGSVTTGTDGRYEFKLQRAASFTLKTAKTNFLFPDKPVSTPSSESDWSPATRANIVGQRAATVSGAASGHSS